MNLPSAAAMISNRENRTANAIAVSLASLKYVLIPVLISSVKEAEDMNQCLLRGIQWAELYLSLFHL